jgi:hypothetical protein
MDINAIRRDRPRYRRDLVKKSGQGNLAFFNSIFRCFMSQVLIWDGIEFQYVDEKTASALVSEDKAQRVDENFNQYNAKFRSQFTGYARADMVATSATGPKIIRRKKNA